jgi:ABC-2 type transport system permease protein
VDILPGINNIACHYRNDNNYPTGKNDDMARFISPFRYFDITYIIKNASYETSYLITSGVIVVIAVVASYIIYSRKDIHAVS